MITKLFTFLLVSLATLLCFFSPLSPIYKALLLVLIGGIAAYTLRSFYKNFREIIERRGCSPLVVFRYFKQKIYMTAGLGLFFISLYICFNTFASVYLTRETFSQLLQEALKDPSTYVKWAALIFALNAMLIYFVRIGIMYLFFKRHTN